VHHLLSNYHGERIDATHILVLGNYPSNNHAALDAHEKCFVMPSCSLPKKLHAHAAERGKHHLVGHLSALGVDETWTSADLAQEAVNRYGVKFELSS
jgi:hypothetical protein